MVSSNGQLEQGVQVHLTARSTFTSDHIISLSCLIYDTYDSWSRMLVWKIIFVSTLAVVLDFLFGFRRLTIGFGFGPPLRRQDSFVNTTSTEKQNPLNQHQTAIHQLR